MRCQRCSTDVPVLWATIEMFSRYGNFRAFDLCKECTDVAYAFVLNRPLGKQVPMSIVWDMPVRDPDDIDDAEHHAQCHCMECDPDIKFEMDREDKAWAS